MKAWKRMLLGLLAMLVIIQFFQPKRNLSAQTSSNDISLIHPIPADVKKILTKACNDCHSNNTRYPWYANFQPVAWWLNHHIVEGKRRLNFNEFAAYSLRKQYKKMEETEELLKDGEMPPGSYTSIHTNAKLTVQERKALIDWTNQIRDTMRANYPEDSLIKKK